ncbi:MAG: DNA gyrase subunit A [Cardiobacteriaceae bacterium]|nr:DNA gyrase subunit A [Cardiobacteriaceae bacterium]
MSHFAKEVVPVSLADEMQGSYLDYAMSVIVGRALPDARDGLKPVHRRVMYSMHKQGHAWNKKYVKSATIVGDVMGKYHPHGDSAIYDTLVRMAQDFSLRYPLVDGQGNFGSIDGDPAAAYRYTEARMAKVAHSLLLDIEKETVNFNPNYDGSQQEPAVLPTRLPHLLLNGSSGIAVGMATNIPPHHLGELLDACLCLLDNPEASLDDLMRFVPGPDFPTGALINGVKGIREAYETGRGRIIIRAKTHIEGEEGEKQAIVVDELPYQVNKTNLQLKINELVKEKRLEGISALRDESDKDGIRLVIEVKRGDSAEVVLNNLFNLTQLQVSFGVNMMALVGGRPRLLSLKEALCVFLAHRREVVTRRSLFELRKIRERTHVLEGLSLALSNIDPMIELIKTSGSPVLAKEALLARDWSAGGVVQLLERSGGVSSRPEGLAMHYGLHGAVYRLSPEQAQAILDLRLHRLTGLEQEKILAEYQENIDAISALLRILGDEKRLVEVIKEELQEIREQFNDKRRTEILHNHLDLSMEDLIAEEDRVITLSHEGYIKSQPLSDYEAQKRGGKGKSVTAVKEEDFVERLWVANTHDTMLCFTNKGKVYWIKVYALPLASRGAKGKPMVNLLPLSEGERVNAILTTRSYPEDQYLFFATKQGTVKKTPLTDYARPRNDGIIAINLNEGDELVDVALTDGKQDIMLFSDAGKAMRFNEGEVRSMGRSATGVRGMRISEEQSIIALCVVTDTGEILTVTENGYGKRTPVSDYPCKGRGGMGVISINCSERNGKAVCALQIQANDGLMLVTGNGTLVRTRASEIAVSGRNTQGVRLIRTRDEEKVIAVAKIIGEEESPEGTIEASLPSALPSEGAEV